jgi:chromosomal replication initiator protein
MNSDSAVAWDECLSIIKESIHPQSFTTWFRPINPVKLEDRNLTVQVPSQFFYEWLEGHYSTLINKALLQVLGEQSKLTYSVIVNGNGEYRELPTMDKPKPMPGPYKNSNLNERYQFDNFVEGHNNQFARAAALAVAEAPGKPISFRQLAILHLTRGWPNMCST